MTPTNRRARSSSTTARVPWTPTWRAEAVAPWQAPRVQYVPEPYESFTIRASPLKAARTSAEKSSGSSHAAKSTALSASLK